MPTFSFSELNSNTSTATADGIRNVANTAANFACSLYKNYANAAAGLPDPTGFGATLNSVYSALCTPRGDTPPLPTAPFNGGQCPKLYSVNVQGIYGPDNTPFNSEAFNLLGPIGGVAIRPNASGSRLEYVVLCQPSSGFPLGQWAFLSQSPGQFDAELKPMRVTSFTVTPNDGVDNCGSPTPIFPPSFPPNSNITNNVNVNVGAGLTINAPITIIPIRNSVDVEVRPQIQVNVGPFNVAFDLGGVTVAPNIVLPSDRVNPNPLPPPANYPSPVPPSTGDCPEVNLAPVISRLENLQDDVDELVEVSEDIKECSCPVPYQVQVIPAATADGGIIDLPENTIAVYLNLIKIPENPKIQPGRGGARDQYFCGYYWFGVGNGSTERIPINTATNWFPAPRFATSFSWSLYSGYEAAVSIEKAIATGADAEFADVQLKRKPVE